VAATSLRRGLSRDESAVDIRQDQWTARIAALHLPADPGAEVRRIVDPAAAERTLHWGRNYLYLASWHGATTTLAVVVKQFRHDSRRARLRRRHGGSNAERSWRVATALRAAGIATPEPVACIESVAADGPAWYISRQQACDFELRYFLRFRNSGVEAERFAAVDGERLLRAVAELTRRLHEAAIWHRDLTSGNVLVRYPGGTTAAPELWLLDLNRARLGAKLSTWRRMRELGRMPVLRREDRELYLAAYWGRAPRWHERLFYWAGQRAFLLKNDAKRTLRAPLARLWQRWRPRRPHAHIPAAPDGASARDRIVWDALSDQPHQHAGGWEKLRVRLADTPAHLEQALVVLGALPRIVRRYRQLRRELYRQPAPFPALGVGIRPWPDEAALLAELEALGARHVLLRLHPWQERHDAEESLARALHAQGFALAYALPQTRELVRDPARWRAALEHLVPRFAEYGKRFQIGQAINRSKWGIWNVREYGALASIAQEVLARTPGVESMGPAVIDFEYYQTIAALNLPRARFHLDAVSALLYVDRRGAPENRQAGLDTTGKVVLLKAIADTARHAAGRCVLSEVNWPLREGPHSPAGKLVSVTEEEQANYAVRYYLLAQTTGLVERIHWWQLIAKGYGLVDPSDGGGLRRRPAFAALANLERQLGGAEHRGPLPASGAARLHLFRRADRSEVVVGWVGGNTAQEVQLPRPARALTERDGKHSALAASRVTVMPAPRYFELTAE
jgi:tRNA A-37 threonylcarbamoyl transferase component Bud32